LVAFYMHLANFEVGAGQEPVDTETKQANNRGPD